MPKRLCLVAVIAAAACGGEDPTRPALHPGDQPGRVVVDFDADTTDLPNDPFALDSARIDGDTLHVYGTSGGGCEEHEFALLAVEGWRESYPVQVPLFLAHEDHDDACDAIVRFHLRYDMTPLAGAYREAYRVQSDSAWVLLDDHYELTPEARLLYRF